MRSKARQIWHCCAIRIGGEPYHARRREMRRHKVSCLPEEPLKNACVARMSVADNLAFREFDRPPFARGGWWLDRSRFRERAARAIGLYKIKTRSTDTPIGELSGGNVQRAVLARELSGSINVLIAANTTGYGYRLPDPPGTAVIQANYYQGLDWAEAGRQADNIDGGKALAFPKIAQGDFEIIF